VAVIDSGVAPVPDLDDPDKLYHGPDVSFEAYEPELAQLDTYGHGTHMVGIITGRGTAAVSGRYAGDTSITHCEQPIRSVGPWAGQPSFTAVPEALTISILSPTVS
jgi:hypothetical protein